MSGCVLITGVSGEVGHSLVQLVSNNPDVEIIAIDIHEPEANLKSKIKDFILGNICDANLVNQIFQKYNFDNVFHLAAILSTSGERNPELAHQVNVQGTFNLLSECAKLSKTIKFIFPSSIAAYGLPNINIKMSSPPVKEIDFCQPITIYGRSKLYCEMLGEYYSRYYKLLDLEEKDRNIDFRCVRFPGLISATTLPSGGTSDYAPEMIHAGAQGNNYECFVRPDSTIPFMAMPDGAKALIDISEAKKENLKRIIYNIAAFSISAKEIEEKVHKFFPSVQITYVPHERRQKIVDSWPKEIDDTEAQKDWGWKPNYDLTRTFEEYLIPTIKNRYK